MKLSLHSVLIGLGLTMLPLAANAQYARPVPPPVVVARPGPVYAQPAPQPPVVAQPSTTIVYSNAPPPRPRMERRTPPPGPGQNWVPGYWSWNGTRHDWTAGHWEAPPRRNARWVEPRWTRRGGRWEMQPGRWR